MDRNFYDLPILKQINDDKSIVDVSIHPHQEIFIDIGQNNIVYYNYIDQHVNK